VFFASGLIIIAGAANISAQPPITAVSRLAAAMKSGFLKARGFVDIVSIREQGADVANSKNHSGDAAYPTMKITQIMQIFNSSWPWKLV